MYRITHGSDTYIGRDIHITDNIEEHMLGHFRHISHERRIAIDGVIQINGQKVHGLADLHDVYLRGPVTIEPIDPEEDQ